MGTDVLVLGSINMDIVARAATIPSPGETLAGSTLEYFPGGKGANQAVAARRAGAPTRLIGCLGEDGFGAQLRGFLDGAEVDTALVRDVQGPSGVALIVVADSGENSIVVVPGANALAAADQANADAFASAAVGIAQFEVPVASIEAFFARCQQAGVLTVLNTAPAIDEPGDCLDLADVLVLNETELAKYSGAVLHDDTAKAEIVAAARDVRSAPTQIVIVTLGARGVVAVAADTVTEVAGRAVEAVDTTGAGDCFVGYLAAGLRAAPPAGPGERALTEALTAALRQANLAASLCVQSPGAAPSIPSVADLPAAP
ncbi:MAG: ribokinase [Pseudomonadota bacterium]